MELLKVWVALILSFCWLLRNLKIKWAEDLRGIQITQQNMFNWAVCAVMFSVEGCWLSSNVFHRSGFGVVGAWAYVWEALACVQWQGQLLHYQFTTFLHRVCTKCFIVSERDFLCFSLQVCNGSKEQPYVNPKAPVHIITGSAVSAFTSLLTFFHCKSFNKLTAASTKTMSAFVHCPACAAVALPHEFSTSCSSG